LNTVNFYGNTLGDVGVQDLLPFMSTNDVAKAINLGSNLITEKSLKNLGEMFKAKKNYLDFDYLDLSLNNLNKKESYTNHSLFFQNMTDIKISELYLCTCLLDDKICEYISQFLKNNSTLTVLSLKFNHITGKGFKDLIKALNSNQSLQLLDVSQNDLDNKAFSIFIEDFHKLSLYHLKYLSHAIKMDKDVFTHAILTSKRPWKLSLLDLEISNECLDSLECLTAKF
jgi:hypothetical protein